MSESGIFKAAIKLPADHRAAYLDETCGANAELRREVESLLRAADASSSFLRDQPMRPQETADFEPITERAGTIIGPYKLMEQIGEGGMGLVFVAEQQHPIRRKVALKVIKPGMDSRDVIARFEAERQALALMDHPHIAKVLDAGTTESGRPYFVMELVKGIPITDYCDQNQLTPRERLALFAHVCQAVQHAHSKGVIHRDIKPSNVLVTLHDGTPVVKVIDFGVAKAIGQQLTEKTIYTQFAQMIGTPLYMSPEQAEMSGLDIDTRSDIYSLGVLLYELLTGTTPFDSERLKNAAFDEVRRIIREEEPPKPSTRLSTLGETLSAVSSKRNTEPRKLSALVRGDLDWIVMKALDKDRNQRYETASEFGQDIQRHLRDEPVVAGPPTMSYRLRKFAHRHRTALRAWSVFAVILFAGMCASGWFTLAQWKRAYFDPRAVDRRGGGIPYHVIAKEGHVSFISRSLTLIFEAAPDKLVGTNQWWGNFPIPWKGIVSIKSGPAGTDKVAVSGDCDNHVSTNTISLAGVATYQVKITDNAPDKLTIGGETFDVYGEPRIVRIGKDGNVH